MKTKNTKNITLALLLVLCTALFALPAMAQELTIPSARTQVTLSETIDEQELFDGFALRELYGMRGISTWGVAARETLSDRMKNLYDALKPEIEKVALGQRASTVFTFTAEEFFNMGFNTIFSYTTESDFNAQIDIFQKQINQTDFSALLHALMLDCPYDMYWYNQTGYAQIGTSGAKGSDGIGTIVDPYVYLPVAPKFQNGDQYSMDTSFGANATAAAAKAAQIIENAKSMSDREKLEYYCEQICALTTYDHTAAANPSVNYSLDSNPWQLINVFDGDPDTNVVCEGYSKAFQYLCDETSFSSSSTMSYLVSGVMTGATGAGNHMWNVVTLSSINYLVDVTNSDVGSVGNAEYFDPDPLFLSLPASGTMNTTYTFIAPSVSIGGGYYTEEATIAYSYDEKTLDMWGEDILTLGGEAHTCDFSGETTYEYLNAAQHSVIVKCTGCDKTQTTAVGHTETTAATCTDAAYCGDCKHSYGEKNTSAHPASAVITYTDNGNGTHSGKYSCCGASTAAEAHTLTYTDNEDGTTHVTACSVCDYVDWYAAHTPNVDKTACTGCKATFIGALTVGGETAYYSLFPYLIDNMNGVTGTLTLLTDYTNENGNGLFNIMGGANMTIDLNGHSFRHYSLYVWGDSNLVVKDSAALKGGFSDGSTLVVEPGSTLTIDASTDCVDWEIYNDDDFVSSDLVIGTDIIIPEGFALVNGNTIYDETLPSGRGADLHKHSWETSWTSGEETHWHACAGCNAKEDETVHTESTAATCTDAAYCDECKHSYGEKNASAHPASAVITYTDNGNGTHSGKYSCCDAAAVTNEKHTIGADGKCSKCTAAAVAKIVKGSTETPFTSFADALNAWTDGTTLVLLDDVTYSKDISLSSGASRTFNGGKFTLTMDNADIVNNGTLTIASGAIVADFVAEYSTCIYNAENATLNIKGGTITNRDECIASRGTVTMTGGTLLSTGVSGFALRIYEGGNAVVSDSIITGSYGIANEGELSIEDSTITSVGTEEETEYSYHYTAINNQFGASLTIGEGTKITGVDDGVDNNGTAVMNGGSITANDYAIYNRRYFTINNGSVTSASVRYPAVSNTRSFTMHNGSVKGLVGISNLFYYEDYTPIVTITGGTISAEKEAIINNGNMDIVIEGGTITSSSADTIYSLGGRVEGYKGGDVTISGGTISSTSGSGVTSYAPTTISGGTITGGNYGVNFDSRASELQHTLNISGASISGNTADLSFGYGKCVISDGIPADGWTFFNDQRTIVGENLILPEGYALHIDDEIVTSLEFDSISVIRKISPHTCDFSGEVTYEYLSDTQHNVIVKCTGCDETQTTPENHTETIAATCTDAAYCGDCKHSYGDVNVSAHPASAVISYADNKDGTHTGSYSCCGATTAAEAHTLGADGKCSKCTAAAVAILTEGGATSYLSTFKSLSETLSGKTAALTLLTDYTSENSSGALNAMDGANITIDLNSNSFECSLIIHNGSAMTVKDSGETKGSFGNHSLSVKRGGSLTIEESAACEDWIIMNVGASGSITVGTEVILPDGCVLRNDRGLEITELAPNSWGYLHLHSFTYAASGSTITETCLRGCSHSATLTLCAPTELTYSASAKEAALEGSLANASAPAVVYSTADGSAPVDAGDYTASITVSGKTASVDFTIAPKAITANAEEITREYAADAALKAVALTLSGVISEDDVSGTADFILSSINAGTYTAAELTAYALTGEDADNYAIAPQDVAFTRATITKASADKWTADVAYGQDILVGSSLDAISFPSKGTGIGNEVVAITSAAAHTDAAATIPLTQDAILSAKKGDTLTLYYRIAAQNYEDRIGEMNLYFVEHEHDWTYSAKDNVITAVCSGAIGTCPNASVTLTLAAPTDLIYSGSAKEASVTVDPTGAIAAPAITYSTADGSAPVAPGKYTASITVGSSTASIEFEIAAAALNAEVTLSPETVTYNGSEQKPAVTVAGLTEGKDYTVTFPADMTSAGVKTITVTGMGNYSGIATKTFTIEKASLTAPDFTFTAPANLTYDGKAKNASVTTVKTDAAVTVKYSADPVNVGDYTMSIDVAESANYKAASLTDASWTFSIAPKTVTEPIFSGLETLYVHTGSAIEPEFTLLDGTAVIPADEYDVAYSNNVDLGTATITVTDKTGGNYVVAGTATFQIAKHEHEWTYTASGNVITAVCSGTIGTCPNASVTLTLAAPSDLIYSGSAKEASVTVDPTGAIAAPAITYSTEDGSAPVNAGTYDASITLGDAAAKTSFTIEKAELTAADFVFTAPASLVYDGSTKNAKVMCTKTDCVITVKYNADPVNVGTYTVSIDVAQSKNYNNATLSSENWTFAITPASIAPATVAAADQVYTGEELKPAITVTLGGKTLLEGTDFTVAYSGNVNVGTAAITVTGAGNYEGSTTGSFTIAPKTVSVPTFSGLEAIYVHTGSEVKPEFTLMDGSAVIPAEEYTVAYSNNVNLGTATITVADVAGGNYTVSGTATFEIAEHAHVWACTASGNVITATCSGTIGTCPIASKTATITLSAPAALTYDGSEKPASVTVDPTGAIAAPAITYSTEDGSAPVAAGTYTASVTLGGKTAMVNYTIAKASLSGAEVTAAGSFTYTGEAIVPTVAVSLGGKPLTEGADYTVAIANNVNAGTANVTVTGAGSYEGIAKATFAIAPASIAGAIVKAENQVYTGEALTPSVTVALGSKTLTAGTDYEITAYSGNTAAGTANVTVTGKGNYEGTANGTFDITQSASAMTAAADAESYTYGDVITVTAEVKATGESPAISLFRLQRTAKPQMALFLGGTQLTGYEDVTDGKCTLTYDTKEKGIAPADAVTLTVRYTGDANTAEQEATVTFGFTAKEVAPAITGSASKTYDGTANIPADNTLAIMLSGVLSVDSNSASASYAFDGADAGEVLAVNASGITLTGSDAKFYTLATDKATASVGTITPASVTDAVVTADDQVYTGSALTPSVTVTLDGKTLVINQDYTVAGYENNTLVGTASVTVKGLGNYVGTATGSFEIVKASPVTKAPDGLVASYDSKLSDITLPEHTLGTWSWVSPTDAVGNVGEQKHQIVFTPFDPDQYSTITLTATVSVVKADMTFSDSFKVLLGSEESTVFTYGDTITVKAKPEIERPAMFMSLRAFSAPKANQMALFLGDQQISNAVDADSTGVYTMAIDTTNKALKIGENAITAKYVGTDNVNDYSQTAAVTLNAKVLTITSVKANNRVYKAGNTLVTVTGAEFDGKVSADDDVNIAQVKGDVGSDAVGAYSSVLLPDSLSLTGKDASLYTLAAAASAPTSVEIVAIPADLTVEADVDETFDASDIPQSLKDAGFDTTDEVNDALRKAIDEQAAASAPEGSAQTESANPIADTATSFVGIVYIEDGEKIEGDPEHFPADAPLKVLLPIPEGTDPDANEYFAAYMTTSETENHKPGEVITVPVSVVYDENGNPMLLVEITDIAPVMIGWTVKDVAIDLPETGDASRLGLWLMLMCMSMTAIVFLRKRSRC